MNNWLYKLERKYGEYAIPELTKFVILTYVAGYVLQMMGVANNVSFDPYLILQGQVWRIFSWILVPPFTLGPLIIITLFFYYWVGTSLERTWGDFRFNLYMLSGFLFTVVGAFIIYGIGLYLGYQPSYMGELISYEVSTYYVSLTLILAFAASYPDMVIRVYFLFPIPIKWLAFLDAGLIVVDFYFSKWYGRGIIVVSLLNFLLFYFSTKSSISINPKERNRRRKFRKEMNKAKSKGWTPVYAGRDAMINRELNLAKHTCAVCGRTDVTNPELEFRYCSKCNGNYEYCSEHLYTHEHVQSVK